MNVLKNTKKTKKFILVIVAIILFSFAMPKQVKAFDFEGNISNFFFACEKGVLNFLNDIFCDSEHEFDWDYSKNGQINFTAENIIKGKFLLFDANIFKEVGDGDYYDKFEWLIGTDGDYVGETLGYYEEGAKVTLRNTIAGWYYSLRNFAIVALLSVLVYVGIRMITSTISQDKAKYKMMFKDWLIAICLLVAMHYIMIGVLNFTDEITKAIGIDTEGGTQIGYIMSLIENINENKEQGDFLEVRYIDDEGTKYHISDAYAYEMLLLGIIVLTGLFAWKYMKREFTIIFLILLGPISCVTYPIDKISDGKAQAFNKWLTEFIYNVLVQPFHLLLYTVLCGSAVQLANRNVLYGFACMLMLIPAEKFVKEMFGFREKIGGGPLAAASMGAIGSQIANRIKGGGSGKSSNSGGKDSSNTIDKTQVRTKKPDGSALVDGDVGDTQTGNNGGVHDKDNINIEDTEEQMQNGLPVDDSIETQDGLPVDGSTETQDGLPVNNGAETQDGLPLDGSAETQDGLPVNNGAETQKEEDTEEKNKLQRENDIEPKDESPATNGDGSNEKTDGASSQDKQSFGSRLKQAHRERLAEKYGTADTKKIWDKRRIKAFRTLVKGTYKAAKGSLKMAGALGGATLGAAFGLLSGKGIAAGAAAGYHLTGRVINRAEGYVSSTVNDYKNRMETPEKIEKRQKKEYGENKKNVERTIKSYKERHNGVGPSAEQFEKDLEDRYELSSYGMKDDDIDDAIEIYQAEFQQQKDNGKSDEEAKRIAASKIVTANKFKKIYSADKFTDPKHVTNIVKSVSGRLQADTGCSAEVADRYAREYVIKAGKMHGLKEQQIALPPKPEPPAHVTERNDAIRSISARGEKPTEQGIQKEIATKNSAKNRLNSRGIVKPTEQQIQKEIADGNSAIQRLNNKGILEPTQQQIDKEVEARNEAIKRLHNKGIDNPSEDVIESETEEMRIRQSLIDDNNFTNEEIKDVDELVEVSGESYATIKDRILKVEVEYERGNTPQEIVEFVGQEASKEEVRSENIERLKVEFMTKITDPKQISKIRRLEVKNSNGDAQRLKEMREVGKRAIKNNGNIVGKDTAIANDEVKELVQEYVKPTVEKAQNKSKVTSTTPSTTKSENSSSHKKYSSLSGETYNKVGTKNERNYKVKVEGVNDGTIKGEIITPNSSNYDTTNENAYTDIAESSNLNQGE